MNYPPRSAFGAPPQGGSAGGPATPDPRRPLGNASSLLDERAKSKLRWRCRRGMLENDLFIERFFHRHEATLTTDQACGLHALMELPDNDLLDLLLARREPVNELDCADVRNVLALLRTKGSPP